MFQSLLVLLDGSHFSERSLPLAEALARASGGTVHLVHVHVPHTPDHFLSHTQFHYEGLDLEQYEARHLREETEYLEGVKARLDPAVAVQTALLEGQVAEVVAAHAVQVGADLVLITTHGHTGVSRMWLGSVADALIRLTHLPLLVIHPAKGEHVPADVVGFRHIMVALDGSELSTRILRPAAALAEASGAVVTLVHVVGSAAGLGTGAPPLLPGATGKASERAREYLESQAAGLRERGLTVHVHVEAHESPGRALAAIADKLEANAIALATHGYGGLKRALLGSVADKVLRSSSLPLLVQRPDGG